MSSRVLLVAGAVSYDYLLYPMTVAADGTHERDAHQEDGEVSQLVIRTGGADLVAQLLTAAAQQHDIQVLGPSLQAPASNCLKHNASCICDLTLDDLSPNETPAYSVARLRRIGRPPVWHAPAALDNASIAPASTVVITGSGATFRDLEPALDFLQRVRPRYIIHHMTRPLATGPLWDMIRNGPMTRDGVPDPEYMAIIIDADDLRAEGIALSQSLSWEATAEDFVRNLGSNGRLDTLVTCPNLIVRFGAEGVIHHRGRDAADPKLYYHPRKMEAGRQLEGETHMVCFTMPWSSPACLHVTIDWTCVSFYSRACTRVRGFKATLLRQRHPVWHVCCERPSQSWIRTKQHRLQPQLPRCSSHGKARIRQTVRCREHTISSD